MMHSRYFSRFLRIFLSIGFLALFSASGLQFVGCRALGDECLDDDSSNDTSSCNTDDGGNGNGSDAAGKLFTLDRSRQAIDILDGFDSANGSVSPDRTLSGDLTEISNPVAFTLDSSRNFFYVADLSQKKILVFENARTVSGNIAPVKRFIGIETPSQLFYDATNDRLYLSDTQNKSLKIWDLASTLVDQSSPSRTFILGYVPSSFTVDVSKDLLYVADNVGQSIKVYSDISSAINLITPTREIKNSQTAFTQIAGLQIYQNSDLLFVFETGTATIDIFEQASTLNATVAPGRVLEGDQTTLDTGIRQILFFDNVLYGLLGSQKIAIWNNAKDLDGNQAPSRQVTMSGSVDLVGIAVSN